MKNKQFLEDLLAFVEHSNNDPVTDVQHKYKVLVGTLLHDLNGMIEEEPFFLPRVAGYAKNMALED